MPTNKFDEIKRRVSESRKSTTSSWDRIIDDVSNARQKDDEATVDEQYIRRFFSDAESYLSRSKYALDNMSWNEAMDSGAKSRRNDTVTDLTNRAKTINRYLSGSNSNADIQGKISEYLDAINKTSTAFDERSQYFSSWKSQDEYDTAARYYDYSKKYNGKNSTELQSLIDSMEDGEEKEWLKSYEDIVGRKELLSVGDSTSQNYDPDFNKYVAQGKEYLNMNDQEYNRRIAEYDDMYFNAETNEERQEAEALSNALREQELYIKRTAPNFEGLDEDERQVYLYHLGKDLEAGTMDYSDTFYEELTGRKNNAAQDNPVSNFFSNIFQAPEAWEDGFQLYDIPATISGTLADAGVGLVKGGMGFVEGLFDHAGYTVAGVADIFGADGAADTIRSGMKWSATDAALGGVSDWVNQASILGDSGDMLAEGVGQVFTMGKLTKVIGTAFGLGKTGMTVLSSFLTGSSSAGHGITEAYEGNATDGEAYAFGLLAGTAEAVSELLWSGAGKFGNKLGIAGSQVGLDDFVSKKVANVFSGTFGRNMAQYLIGGVFEGAEGLASGFLQAVGKRMTYLSEKDFADILADENLLEQFLAEAFTSYLAKSPDLISKTNAGRDLTTGLSDSETFQLDTEFQNYLQKSKDEGYELSKKQQKDLYEKVQNINAEANRKSGGSLTSADLHNLFTSNDPTITADDTKKIQAAAEKTLTEYGETGDVKTIASAIAKQTAGERLTFAEKKALQNSKYAERVSNELDPEKMATRDYTSSWAENLGTKVINKGAYNFGETRAAFEEFAKAQKAHNAKIEDEEPATYKSLDERIGTEGRFGVSDTGKSIVRDTGKEVDIDTLKFKKITEDGKVKLVDPDGTVVDAGWVDWADDGQSYLVSAVSAIENITPESATDIIRIVDRTKPLGPQMNGIDQAFTYGYNNYSKIDLMAGEYVDSLTNEQMEKAYELGKAARKSNIKNADAPRIKMRTAADATMTEEQKVAKQKARFNSNAEVYFEDGKKIVKFEESGKYSDRRMAAVHYAKFLTKLGIGGKYYFYKSYVDKAGNRVYKNANGEVKAAPNGMFMDSDGSIHIDLNAGEYGQGTTLFTLGHELTHFIKAWSEEKFKVLGDFLIEAYGNTNLSMHERVLVKQKFLQDVRGKDAKVTYDEAFEEVVADAMSTMLTDGDLHLKLAKLRSQDKDLFNKIKQFFNKLIAKFRSEYAQLTPDQQDAQDIRAMKNAFDRIQTAFAEALIEASDNFQAAMESVVETNSKPMPAEQIVTDGAVVTDGNGERHSIRSMKHDIAEGKMFEDLKNVCGWSQAQVATLKTQLTDLVEYMIPYRNILDMNENYGAEGRRFSPYKPNSDPLYKISMDFSTLCSKRLLTQYVIEQLQLRENRPMSAEEQMAIRDMLNEYRKVEKGLQVACAMCYVEAARLKAPKQIRRWLSDPTPHLRNYFAQKNTEFNNTVKEAQADFKESKGYDRNAPKKDMKPADVKELNAIGPKLRSKYQLSAEEQAIVDKAKTLPNSTYLTAGNLADLSETDPAIYAAYTSFVRTATRSKSLESDEPYYYGDSTRDNGNGIVVTDNFIEAVNKENGMRFSSWSDWRIQHLLDYITAVIENSVRGAAMHGYTKFGDEVRVLGNTGMMFNMSGVTGTQTGLNEDGSLNFSETESIDVNEAKQLRDEFPETAGLQCIGVSDAHIIALLRSEIIDYVIPYHVSGLNADLRRMAKIYGWDDYTGTQHAPIDKSIKFDEAVDQEHWHQEPVFSEFFVGYDTGMSGIEAMMASAEKYKQMCKDRGLKPKFEQFSNEDNYWKLLIDRKMINQKTGNLIQQKAVTPTFDFGTIKGVVDKFVQNYDAGLEGRALNHIVENWDTIPQRIKDLKKKGNTKANKTKKAVDTLANQTVAAQPKDGGKFSYRGKNANGIEVYETSEDTKKLSYAQRQKQFLDIMTTEYRGRTAKFIRNGQVYYATFEEKDINKNIYGDKQSDKKGWKAKISVGAEGDIFELVENAKYDGSKQEKGKKITAHRGVGSWDYFIKNVQIDGTVFDLLANVRRKTDGDYVYSINLTENKKIKASPPLGLLSKASSGVTNASASTVTQPTSKVKKNSSKKSERGLPSMDKYDNKTPTKRDLWDDIAKISLRLSALERDLKEAERGGYTEQIDRVRGRLADAEENYIEYGEYLLENYEKYSLADIRSLSRALRLTDSYSEQAKYTIEQFKKDLSAKVDEYRKDAKKALREETKTMPQENKKLLMALKLMAAREGYDMSDLDTGSEATESTNEDDWLLEDDTLFSERGDGVSNRTLLANAFETLSQNSEEYKLIQQYKGRIRLLNEQEEKLSKLNAEIWETRFGKGKYDAEKLKRLEAKAKNVADEITRQDRKLLDMEASEPLRKVIEQERKKEAQKTKEHVREIQQNKKLRAEQAEYRHKIRKTVRDLDKLLNRGNKKTNVKEDMRGFVSKALELADFIFTDHVSNDDLIRKGITVRMTPREEALVRETEDILTKIYDDFATLTAEEFTDLDDKRKRNMEKLRDLLTSQRNERLKTPVYNLFNDLVAEYASLKNSKQDAVKAAYDPSVEMILRNYIGESNGETDSDRVTLLKNMRVADMTTKELENLYYAYKIVLTSVRNANKLHIQGKAESIQQVADSITRDFTQRKTPDKTVATVIRNISNKMGWDYEKLYYALDRIGSEAFTELVMNIANSENIVMQDVIEAALFRDEMVKKYGFNKWDVNKKIDREFLDTTGKKFKLTLGQLMSLYAYSRRKGAWDHIEYGGFVFGEKALTNPKPADSYKLTKDQCEAITNTLTKEQKGYVEDMQKFLSETMGEKGNEVSMLLYGIKMFGEKNYFPIHVAGEYMANAQESKAKEAAGFSSMTSAGFTKAQNPNAKAPFVLEGFNEIWADHVNEMSRYHGTVPALEDFRRVMNRSTYSDSTADSISLRALMENSYGKEAVDYFDNLYREANSGAIRDKLGQKSQKLLSLFRKNSVAYSLSVLIQQPASIVRAYALIDKKYFGIKGFGAITSGVAKAVSDRWTKAHTNAYNEMLKYAPGVTMAKEIGGFDTATGGSIRSYLLDTDKGFFQSMKTENLKGKAGAVMDLVDDNAIANLPNLADKIAWIEIWNACKRETAAKHKDLATSSEEFMKIVGERFTEVIRATQVYDSIFAKSPMLKSKNPAVQYLVSFMNEPNAVANMAESAVRDAARGNWKGGVRKAGTVIYSIIFTNVLKSLIYAMRDDDEEETYIEKYIEAITGGLMDDFNALNYIPLVRDAWSVAQGYDVERADMAIISDFFSALTDVIKNATKDTSDMTKDELAELEKNSTEATWQLVGSLASFFGIPVKNVRREIKGVLDHARIASANAGMTTAQSAWDKIQDSVIEWIPFMQNDRTKCDKLYDAIINGDKSYLDRLKGTYSTDNAYQNAVRKALRENDSRIKEAALAEINGNPSERVRIARLIIADGFKQDDVVMAINSEINALKSDDSSDSGTSKKKGFYTTDNLVREFANGDTASAKTAKSDIISTMVANGKTREDAERDFMSDVASSAKEAYENNWLNESKAKKLLMEYAGKDEEEATSKVNYWTLCKLYPKYKDLFNEARVAKYNKYAKPAGISVDMYAKYISGTKDLSTRNQVVNFIHSLSLTKKQKDALYLAAGYPESKIWDVPW